MIQKKRTCHPLTDHQLPCVNPTWTLACHIFDIIKTYQRSGLLSRPKHRQHTAEVCTLIRIEADYQHR